MSNKTLNKLALLGNCVMLSALIALELYRNQFMNLFISGGILAVLGYYYAFLKQYRRANAKILKRTAIGILLSGLIIVSLPFIKMTWF